MAITFLSVNAQKLPNVQQTSLRLPANVKIDGKTTEWGDKFQAYNTATELFYTIANDDKRLYLVVQTDNQMVLSRIIMGGVTLIVQPSGQKNDKNGAYISFPWFDKNKRKPLISLRDKKELHGASKEISDYFADSVMKENNKKLTTATKWIITKNIPGVDSSLSIYNNNGIEAAHAVDAKRAYNCELSIDLKSIGLSLANATKFTYHVIVNGGPGKLGAVTFSAATDPLGNTTPAAFLEELNKSAQILTSQTDFWGEYTLAKKL